MSPRTAERQARRELRHGLAAIVAVAVVLGVAALVSVLPLGSRTYTAYVADAQSISVGDGIRVAGLPVGEVISLDLESDRVRLRFTVEDEVFVGRESSMQVRMLTVVGGHYIALTPAGTDALGDEAIPLERVALPYSLSQVFQDAIAPIGAVDAAALRRSLTAAGQALDAAPDSLRRTLDGLTGFVEVLGRQDEQISRVLAVVDEYSDSLVQTRGQLRRFVDSVNRLETIVLDKQSEMRSAGEMTVSVVQRIAGLDGAYAATVRPLVPTLLALGPALRQLADRLDEVLASVRSLATGTAELLAEGGPDVDHSDRTVRVPGLCIPLPGKVC